MLNLVKQALRITTDAYNDELNTLIEAAAADLGIAGIINLDTTADPLVQVAVVTYCRLHFGVVDDYDRLKASYDEQKAQLSTASGYTDWLTD